MKKYHKTVFKVTVLSEEPFEYDGIESIAYSITQGDCSGHTEEIKRQRLTGKQMAKELLNQGSDPEFFQLDKEGNEIEE